MTTKESIVSQFEKRKYIQSYLNEKFKKASAYLLNPVP
jgi:hypothetical protein